MNGLGTVIAHEPTGSGEQTPDVVAILISLMNKKTVREFAARISGEAIKSLERDKDAPVDGQKVFDSRFDLNDYHTRVGIVVLDEKTGKIILRRPSGLFGGVHWSFAKGGIDRGEDALEAAFREVEEEIDIGKDSLTLKGALKGMYRGGGSKNYYFIATVNAEAVFEDGVAAVVYPPCYETERFVFADLAEAKPLIRETTNRASRYRDLKVIDDLVPWAWAQAMDSDLEDLSGSTQVAAVKAIQANSLCRFKRLRINAGINNWLGYPTTMVKDSVTKRKYVIREPVRDDVEHLKALATAIVTDELGFPTAEPIIIGAKYTVEDDAVAVPGVKWAGQKVTKWGDTENRLTLCLYVEDAHEAKLGKNSFYHHRQIAVMLAQQYLIGEPDNNSDNRLWLVDREGQQIVVTIDPGKAFVEHDPYYREVSFGGKFQRVVDRMSANDFDEVLRYTQEVLLELNIDAVLSRLETRKPDFDESENRKLDSIAAYIEERYANWENAFAEYFPNHIAKSF